MTENMQARRAQSRQAVVVRCCLNDLEGHEKGDQAITAIANGLFHQLVTGCYLYRMGGDEFAMLCLKKDKQMVEEMIQKAQKEIAEVGYEIAWGIAEYKPGMNFEEIYRISDERMYECKRAMKMGRK